MPPLGLPRAATLHRPGRNSRRYEAVALFVERARGVKTGLRADRRQRARPWPRSASRLDGLPLAIELAAARVRLLPPQRCCRAWTDRLELLTGGARDRPERQQTLRGAIAWSHDLLRPPEHVLFARLAVFAGGWTLGEAEAVANSDGDLDVFDGLAKLVDHTPVRLRKTRMSRAFRCWSRSASSPVSNLQRVGGEAELTARPTPRTSSQPRKGRRRT